MMQIYLKLGPRLRRHTRRAAIAGGGAALLVATALMVVHVALKPRPRILDAIGL